MSSATSRSELTTATGRPAGSAATSRRITSSASSPGALNSTRTPRGAGGITGGRAAPGGLGGVLGLGDPLPQPAQLRLRPGLLHRSTPAFLGQRLLRRDAGALGGAALPGLLAQLPAQRVRLGPDGVGGRAGPLDRG